MLVGLFSLITVPAYAQGDEDALAAEVVRALDELKSTGTLSVQARENLKNHPEIAAQVPDPDKKIIESVDSPRVDAATPDGADAAILAMTDVAIPASAGARGCWITDYNIRQQSLLGSTLFRFHQQIHWCADGVSVTSTHVRYHHLTDTSTVVNFRSLTANTVNPVPAGYVESYMQGQIDLCVLKYGCYATYYPWVKIKMWGNGTQAGEWGGASN